MSIENNVFPIDPKMTQLDDLDPEAKKSITEIIKRHATGGHGGGGNFGIEIRVARLEEDVKEIKSDIKSIKDNFYAVKTNVGVIKNEISSIKQSMASKSDVKAEVKSMQSTLIMWTVGTIIAAAGVAATIARLI